jgi:cytochrome P450
MVEAARAHPGDDLFSALIGLELTDEQVCATAYFLLIAGQETTSMLISSLLFRLLTSPERWRAAAEDRPAVEASVERTLAEESSVPTWRRTTRAPVVLDGVTLPKRAEVLLSLTGIDAASELAFGIGVHRCLGAALARMESRVVVQTLARAFPGLRSVEPTPPRIELLSFAAPARVLVTDRVVR